jgi:hypothetical protein
MQLSSIQYGFGVIFTVILGIIPIIVSYSKEPTVNPLYGTTSTLLLTYSVGASLLMYVMMLYFFTAFPMHQTLFVLGFDVLLIITTLLTLFFNPWKVKARKESASGITFSDPAVKSATFSVIGVLLFFIILLLTFTNSELRKGILLLTNLFLIPLFFLTSGFINSFALNDFTHFF